jgi:hypothetical protein
MNDQISLQFNKITRIIENEEQFKILTNENILKSELNNLKNNLLINLDKLQIEFYKEESEKDIKNYTSQTKLIENDHKNFIIYEKIKNLTKSKEKKYIFYLINILKKFMQDFHKNLKTKIHDFEDYLIILFLSESDYKLNSTLISERENYKKYIPNTNACDYLPSTYPDFSGSQKEYFCLSYLTLNDFIKFIQEMIKNIQFITIHEAQKNYTILQKNNINPGEYILHPKDKSKLIPTTNYYTSITKTKNDELIDLLAQMGAKEIKISEKIQKNTSIDTDIKVKALFLSSNASLNIEKDYYNFFEIKASFVVSPHHIVDPHLIKKSIWFNDDSQIETIFKYRISNTVSIQNYSINIECNKTQKIEFSTNACIKLLLNFDIDFDYNSINKRELIFDVKF